MFDGILGRFGRLVVDESVALGDAEFVDRDFAGENVSKGTERVVECLVVDGGIEVLDEDITRAGFAERGIALRPHDTTRTVLDQRVVEFLKRLFS